MKQVIATTLLLYLAGFETIHAEDLKSSSTSQKLSSNKISRVKEKILKEKTDV